VKWIVCAVVVVVAGALVIALVGYLLPVAHTAARSTHLAGSPEAVYARLTDVGRFPVWRRGLTIERLPDANGRPVWIEHSGKNHVTMTFERMEPPTLLVARIADRALPFGGTWTYRLTPARGGTDLSITENGEVYNPIFRFVSRFVFGHYATLDAFLSDLER
jgi:hypothetical protein